ncbi:siderophore ABC transporter substrate-binding protein [uncultured Roseobacter sp.]|uniref:siderophore ABC transporter substrate-binding protein n=1 Tax=uncultured Roseobacter sp. TaxID=114847 RepID=UPI00260CC56F|nr:siderophore ABC transporter substrate-binding protein [uncultured Roseobacter sp.]
MLARLTALILLILSTGTSAADTLELETAQGVVSVPAAPDRVAVFDVAVADTLDALGVSVAGTMGSLYVDYLQDMTAQAENLGSFFEPDFEAVHALAPDLIIVGSRSSDQLNAMARIAPSIDMTVGDDLWSDAITRLRSYGQLFNVAEKAAALEQALNKRLAQAREVVQGRGDALVIMTNGPKISAYGAGGRFGWLHKDVGLSEAAPETGASTHGEAISFEFIKAVDPDWLIVVDRLAAIGQPGESAAATLDNAIMHQTRAWSSGQVIYLNAADIYIAGGGIQSMMRTLDDLIAGFQGR